MTAGTGGDESRQSELSARAQSAVVRLRAGRTPARGGLIGAIARILGLGPSPARPQPLPAEADTAELHTLRSDLVRELERIAERESSEAPAKEPSAGEGAQADAAA